MVILIFKRTISSVHVLPTKPLVPHGLGLLELVPALFYPGLLPVPGGDVFGVEVVAVIEQDLLAPPDVPGGDEAADQAEAGAAEVAEVSVQAEEAVVGLQRKKKNGNESERSNLISRIYN